MHLEPGGIAVLLANWLYTSERSWHDRLAEWAPPGCQMWVVQRERLTPPEYVEVWLRDSTEHGGPDHEARYAEWLTYFDDLGATGVGFGWIVLRRSEAAWFVAEDVCDAERLPDGAEVLAQLQDFSRLHDASAVRLLGASPRWSDRVELHRSYRPAADGSGGSVLATGDWRPAEDVSAAVMDVMARQGGLADRLDACAADSGESIEAVTADVLIGLRRLIAAGLVAIEGDD